VLPPRLWLVYRAQMAVLENSVGRLALESPDWDWALPAALPGKSPPRALLDPARPHFVNSVRRTVTALPAPRSTGREFSAVNSCDRLQDSPAASTVWLALRNGTCHSSFCRAAERERQVVQALRGETASACKIVTVWLDDGAIYVLCDKQVRFWRGFGPTMELSTPRNHALSPRAKPRLLNAA
jgi:hypothetical protein